MWRVDRVLPALLLAVTLSVIGSAGYAGDPCSGLLARDAATLLNAKEKDLEKTVMKQSVSRLKSRRGMKASYVCSYSVKDQVFANITWSEKYFSTDRAAKDYLNLSRKRKDCMEVGLKGACRRLVLCQEKATCRAGTKVVEILSPTDQNKRKKLAVLLCNSEGK